MAAFLNLHGKSKSAKLTSFYRRAPNAAGGLYLRCQDDKPNTFAWVMSIHPYIHPVNAMWIFGYSCVRPFSSQLIFFKYNNHHHHLVLVARISLTLSRHSSLSFIALGRSSGQHPVVSHNNNNKYNNYSHNGLWQYPCVLMMQFWEKKLSL